MVWQTANGRTNKKTFTNTKKTTMVSSCKVKHTQKNIGLHIERHTRLVLHHNIWRDGGNFALNKHSILQEEWGTLKFKFILISINMTLDHLYFLIFAIFLPNKGLTWTYVHSDKHGHMYLSTKDYFVNQISHFSLPCTYLVFRWLNVNIFMAFALSKEE